MSYFESTSGFTDLIKVFKLLLVLSHGQTNMEHGFSINKSLLIENLLEGSFISQRIIIDYVKANEYKSLNNPISSDPFKSIQICHNKYSQCLEAGLEN